MKCLKNIIKFTFLSSFASGLLVIPLGLSSCSFVRPEMKIASESGYFMRDTKMSFGLQWTAIYSDAIKVDEFKIVAYDYDSETKNVGQENDTYLDYFDLDFASYNNNHDIQIGIPNTDPNASDKFLPTFFLKTKNVDPPAGTSFAIKIFCEIRKDLIGASDYCKFSPPPVDDTIQIELTVNKGSGPSGDTLPNPATTPTTLDVINLENGYIATGDYVLDVERGKVYTHLKNDLIYEVRNAMDIIYNQIATMGSWGVKLSINDDWDLKISITYHFTTGIVDQFFIGSNTFVIHYQWLLGSGDVKANIKYQSFGQYELLGAFTNDNNVLLGNGTTYKNITTGNYLSFAPRNTIYQDTATSNWLPTHIELDVVAEEPITGWNDIYTNIFYNQNHTPIGDIVNKNWGFYIRSYWLKDVSSIDCVPIDNFQYGQTPDSDKIPQIIKTTNWGTLPQGVTVDDNYNDDGIFQWHIGYYYEMKSYEQHKYQAYLDDQYFIRDSTDQTKQYDITTNGGTKSFPYCQVGMVKEYYMGLTFSQILGGDSPYANKSYMYIIINPVFCINGWTSSAPNWPNLWTLKDEIAATRWNFGFTVEKVSGFGA